MAAQYSTNSPMNSNVGGSENSNTKNKRNSTSPQNNFRLRVGTYNVHSWANGNGTPSTSHIAQTIKSENLDVVGLQEAVHPVRWTNDIQEKDSSVPSTSPFLNKEVLEGLSKYLEMPYFYFAAAGSRVFGNVVLSRYPFVQKETKAMNVPESGEIRSAACVTIEIPWTGEQPSDKNTQEIGIYCLHLDHIKETNRLKQLSQLRSFLDSPEWTKPHLLLGDFNSLSGPQDYPAEKWKEIESVRRTNNWELPHWDVVSSILQGEPEYLDCWKAAGGDPGIASCWVGTRIDYIFATPDFPLKPTLARRNESEASDHFLMVVEFTPKDK